MNSALRLSIVNVTENSLNPATNDKTEPVLLKNTDIAGIEVRIIKYNETVRAQ